MTRRRRRATGGEVLRLAAIVVAVATAAAAAGWQLLQRLDTDGEADPPTETATLPVDTTAVVAPTTAAAPNVASTPPPVTGPTAASAAMAPATPTATPTTSTTTPVEAPVAPGPNGGVARELVVATVPTTPESCSAAFADWAARAMAVQQSVAAGGDEPLANAVAGQIAAVNAAYAACIAGEPVDVEDLRANAERLRAVVG